jgi:chromosome partitioning protein
MLTIASLSLSGGQGKTTVALFLGKKLAAAGYQVLMIDADPQANLTTYLGHEVEPNSPTLLEVLKKSVAVEEGIYPVSSQENLFLIPSDDALDTVQDYLSSSGVGASMMQRRLEPLEKVFQVCIIDSPPQRSQICKSVIGTADAVVIPAETTVKGFGSLVRTMDAVNELKELKASSAEVLGVVPFRDRWTGHNQTSESRMCIEAMQEEVGATLVLPSIRESEQYKKAISKGMTLSELGHLELEYPFEILTAKIDKLLSREVVNVK